MRMSRLFSTFLFVFLATTAAPPSIGAAVDPGVPLERGSRVSRGIEPRAGLTVTDRVVVKFREESGLRLRGGQLVSVTGAVDPAPIHRWLGQNPGIVVARHFVRPEADLDRDRATGQRQSGTRLADLNLYFEFRLPAGSADAARRAVSELRGLPLVEAAFVEPIPSAPVMPDSRREPTAMAQTNTPDFSAQQGYLYASPSGVNAQSVWGFPGGRGAGVKLLDIEGAWLWTHEDLPSPFFEGGSQIDDPSWRNHGTAVMGEMVGAANGIGVTGIASNLQVGGVSINTMSTAAAIDLASATLAVGDLFLIELHAPGPNANGSGQFGYVPMEFWQDNFDAIQQAVANGRICIEAGGNGEQNLDDAVYEGLFDRSVRYSGAILVGAGTPTGLDAEWFTNYGSRLDLNGWGSSVTSCGYGDLQGGAETQWYTGFFSGTSSASPIVTGSVASLQGMCKATWGMNLNGPVAMQLLYDSGTPWVGTKRIGRRPDLLAARQLMLQGISVITGTVREAGSNTPLAGTTVVLPSDAVRLSTDAGGTYTATVRSGSHQVRAFDFFHQTVEQGTNVAAGRTVTLDFSLPLKPVGSLSGTFTATGGAPLANGSVIMPGTPIPVVTADLAGDYTVPQIPAATGYLVLFGLVPGYGADARTLDIAAGQIQIANAILAPAQTFESGNGGFTGDVPWAWGTPSGPGPGGAFSGTKLWATNLTGNYGDNQSAYLLAPAQSFPGASRLYLSFSHWYELEGGFDGGNLQVLTGTSWQTISPYGGYPMAALSGLGGEDGFSGSSGGWQPVVYDLTPYLPGPVQIRFHFGSDSGVNAPGWYIDDVAFDAESPTSGVGTPPAGPATSAPPAQIRAIEPNPFVESLSLSLRLTVETEITARIVDPAGRELVRLQGRGEPGDFRLNWNGKDRMGRDVPAGTYFCVFEENGRSLGSRRIVRIK